MNNLIKSEVLENLPNIRKIEGVTYELFEEECKIVITFPRRSYERALEIFTYMVGDGAIVVVGLSMNGGDLAELLGVWDQDIIQNVLTKKICESNKIIIKTKTPDDVKYECGCLYYIEGVESGMEVLDRLKADL